MSSAHSNADHEVGIVQVGVRQPLPEVLQVVRVRAEQLRRESLSFALAHTVTASSIQQELFNKRFR